MKQLRCEIIAIGTELLLGQIANTNAQWLSEQLALHGINTFYHTVVGDNPNRVEETFRLAQERSDIIFVSGGLGPTEDDMTREAFQRMSNLNLIEHIPSMKKIESFFYNQQIKMTPNNRRQSRVFAGAKVIDNKVGMAPGMIINHHKKTWIFLPGVPREMKQMATDDVFPYLIKYSAQKMIIQSMILRFIGIGEARLEHELEDIIQTQQNPTIALLAQPDGLIIRLTVKEYSLDKAQERLKATKDLIESKVGSFMLGINEETIEGKIIQLLKEQDKQIAAAESLTGGLFTEKLISVENASAVCLGGIICYDAVVKKEVLKVSPDIIRSYGVVSKECAIEMAKNICKTIPSDIGISFTGVAGPQSIENQPVGTVYISIYHDEKFIVEKFVFHGDRNSIRNRATLKGYELLFNFLKGNVLKKEEMPR